MATAFCRIWQLSVMQWSRDHVLTWGYMTCIRDLDRVNVIIDRRNVISSGSVGDEDRCKIIFSKGIIWRQYQVKIW
jgi:hypothetical protein